MNTDGFPFITEKFLNELSKNNNKQWFAKNKSRFENEFLIPASNFIVELGEKIQEFAPNVIAIPKIDKSIFRIHRDMRFSKDKKPYKTNLGIYIWEGNKPRMECPGFYFHIEPGEIFWGSGIYKFSTEQLNKFRDFILDDQKVVELDEILKRILRNEDYKVGGSELKKIPRGFDPTYKYKKFLLHTGLYTYYEVKSLKEFRDKSILDLSVKIYRDFFPLHKWLLENFD